MVITRGLKCPSCASLIRIRVQVGYLDPAPLRIVCTKCKHTVKAIFSKDSGNTTGLNIETFEVDDLTFNQISYFSTELPINTISHEIPVLFSPYLNLQYELSIEELHKFLEIVIHKISEWKSDYEHFGNAINMYNLDAEPKYILFELNQIRGKKIQNNQASRSRILYAILSKLDDILRPYMELKHKSMKSPVFQGLISDAKQNISQWQKIKSDMPNLVNSDFEIKIGLEHIKKFLQQVDFFFPAIILQLIPDRENNFGANYILTTVSPDEVYAFYIDGFESLCRISPIHMGLHCIIEFGDYNSGIPTLRRDFTNLQIYKGFDHGVKRDLIEKTPRLHSYFGSTLNSQVRNGFGHNKKIYDVVSQEISYFPSKNNISNVQKIHLIDVCNEIVKQVFLLKESLHLITKFF